MVVGEVTEWEVRPEERLRLLVVSWLTLAARLRISVRGCCCGLTFFADSEKLVLKRFVKKGIFK